VKNILCIYQCLPGGATVATQQLVTELRKNNPSKVKIKKIELLNDLDTLGSFSLLKYYFLLFQHTRAALSNKQLSYDQIYSNSTLLLFICYLLHGPVKDYFYHFHGESSQEWRGQAQKESSFIKRVFYLVPLYFFHSLIERYVLKKVKMIFVPTKYSKKEFKKIFPTIQPGKIAIIPYGVSSEFSPLKRKAVHQPIRLLYVGRVDPLKGLTELVEALSLLQKKKIFKMTFIFTSSFDYKYEKKILTEIKKLTIPSVKIQWDASVTQLSKIYAHHDVTILPSYKEQLPLVFLESISSGTPVISSSAGALPDYQKMIDTRLLLDPVRKEKIYKKILWFSSLPLSQREKISQKGQEVGTQFNWQRSADLLKNYLL
jgi:glycosyltransferase involved in cell wall biosynthesis